MYLFMYIQLVATDIHEEAMAESNQEHQSVTREPVTTEEINTSDMSSSESETLDSSILSAESQSESSTTSTSQPDKTGDSSSDDGSITDAVLSLHGSGPAEPVGQGRQLPYQHFCVANYIHNNLN